MINNKRGQEGLVSSALRTFRQWKDVPLESMDPCLGAIFPAMENFAAM
jgi:hypothetical protein